MKLSIVVVLTALFIPCIIYAECNSCIGKKEGTCALKCDASQSDKKKELIKASKIKASKKPAKRTSKNKKGKVTAAETKNMKDLKTEKEKEVLSIPF